MTAVRCLEVNNPAYPVAFHELADPPERIYVCGRMPSAPAVAIVGARRASEEGRRMARALGAAVAEVGAWVVSGGAIGIDAAAHEGALEAGGRTVAVLGSSAAQPGPRQNVPLFNAMLAAGGGYMSESAGAVDRLAFCRRNRLIAALADWVVIVEGQARSGTRYTLRAALQLGRSMAAVTWAPGDTRGAQAEWVFDRGGVPIAGPDALVRRLGRRRRRRRPTGCERASMSVSPGETTVEIMAERLGMTAAETLVTLTQLELEGRAHNLGGGRFRLL